MPLLFFPYYIFSLSSITSITILDIYFITFSGAGADEFLEKQLAPSHLSEGDVGGDPEPRQEGD